MLKEKSLTKQEIQTLEKEFVNFVNMKMKMKINRFTHKVLSLVLEATVPYEYFTELLSMKNAHFELFSYYIEKLNDTVIEYFNEINEILEEINNETAENPFMFIGAKNLTEVLNVCHVILEKINEEFEYYCVEQKLL